MCLSWVQKHYYYVVIMIFQRKWFKRLYVLDVEFGWLQTISFLGIFLIDSFAIECNPTYKWVKIFTFIEEYCFEQTINQGALCVFSLQN